MTEALDPFATATSVRPLGDGSYVANLHPEWAVGDHPHGGYLLALLTRALGDTTGLAPLAVSAQYLRPPRVGPVLIRTEILKAGKTITAARAVLEQSGQSCVDATITLGKSPEGEPVWADLPDMPVNPPSSAIDLGAGEARKYFSLAQVCDMRLDADTAEFLDGRTGPPRLRMWVKPREAQPDLLFGLVAGDLTVPVTLNLARFGWAPTVQLTALLRTPPANGWLRLAVDCRAVQGQWFDEDVMVVDSVGRLVCQARQLAIAP
ncbi:Acyl-CoA thioesterase [Saccharopolyspora kobensis]|uniref:Acyl-CoA thioesterase n=1 Tax=Saccharopolyspora kobensis TaxID=146035 RepID=A0A1H6DYJ5_9PSEU|nr:thioesterase family protein [Saccharopolyspora kobensis]SEG90084.1 Acyl-CoA thioesterase [Saccharopolyspora kobensis]SFD88964.1 Acyl-CoA thioesterase [Saccharopolyspora kobensis]